MEIIPLNKEDQERIDLRHSLSGAYLGRGFTLMQFIDIMGGFDLIKHKLMIRGSQTLYQCWNMDNMDQINHLLGNKMWMQPSVNERKSMYSEDIYEGIMVFVQD